MRIYLHLNHTVSYNITIVGLDAEPVDELARALHRYLRKNKVFWVWYLLFYDQANNRAAKFRLPVTIKEPENIPFGNVTVKKDGITQIHALSAVYEFRLPMLFVEQVAPVDIEVEFMPIIGNW